MSFFNINAPVSPRRQTAINLTSTIMSYTLSLGVSFFLLPYIVKQLGAAAYGFIGLSNNIIGYTSLMTVALNSMSGRFISIKYHEGNFEDSNRYLASTFFANAGIGVLIILILGIITFFLEQIINIPPELVGDVKFLFVLLFANTSLSTVTGAFGICTFIKNRLDLANSLQIFFSLLNATLLIVLYGFFPAHVWYIGMVALTCTIIRQFPLYKLYKTLTPEFKLKTSNFDMPRVMEMVKEGSWNLISSLSGLLNQGLELLLANIFISAYLMGVLSITKTLPWTLLGFFATLANNFQPEYLKFYAQGDMTSLKATLLKSMRILGLFTAIPCAVIFALGDVFYASWLPGQDYKLMYALTCVTLSGLIVSMPTQSLWYIFTMTKSVRKSSVTMLKYSILNVTCIIIAMYCIHDDMVKIFTLVGIQALINIIRLTTFLPVYGARVLGFPKYTLLGPVWKIVFSTAVITAIIIPVKVLFIHNYNWISFFAGTALTIVIGLCINYRLSLIESDRVFLREKIRQAIKKIG